jgi:hypothetical protein
MDTFENESMIDNDDIISLYHSLDLYQLHIDLINTIKNDLQTNGKNSLNQTLMKSLRQINKYDDIVNCEENLKTLEKKTSIAIETIGQKLINFFGFLKTAFTEHATDLQALYTRVTSNQNVTDDYLNYCSASARTKQDLYKEMSFLNGSLKKVRTVLLAIDGLKGKRYTFFDDNWETSKELAPLQAKMITALAEVKNTPRTIKKTDTVKNLGYNKSDLLKSTEDVIKFIAKDLDGFIKELQAIWYEKPSDWFIGGLLMFYLRMQRIEQQYLTAFRDTAIELVRNHKALLRKVLSKT